MLISASVAKDARNVIPEQQNGSRSVGNPPRCNSDRSKDKYQKDCDRKGALGFIFNHSEYFHRKPLSPSWHGESLTINEG